MHPKSLLAATVLALTLTLPLRGQSWRFDFGPGPVADGWMGVTPDMAYDAARGYGFDVMPTKEQFKAWLEQLKFVKSEVDSEHGASDFFYESTF